MPKMTRYLLLIALMSGITSAFAQERPFKELPSDAWQRVSQARGTLIGGQSPTAIQIVFDANCPWSAKLYEHLRSAQSGTAIRWVPVAYFKPDSARQAAAILQSADPAKSLDQNFRAYDFSARHGGYTQPAGLFVLDERNRVLQQRWRQWIGATPVLIVRTPDGRVLMQAGATDTAGIDALIGQADGLKGYRSDASASREGTDARSAGIGPGQ